MLGILGVLGLLSGCTSTGMARTLNKGQVQVSLTPGVVTALPAASYTLPQAEVGVRYGVTDRLDVGARLFYPGVAVDTRVALLRSPTLDSGIDLTLAPTLSAMLRGSSDDKQMSLELPLLVGLNPGAGVQFVLGPRVGLSAVVDPNGVGVSRGLVGGSLGVALPVGRWLRIVPEVTVRSTLREVAPLLQANVGFLIGGYVEE